VGLRDPCLRLDAVFRQLRHYFPHSKSNIPDSMASDTLAPQSLILFYTIIRPAGAGSPESADPNQLLPSNTAGFIPGPWAKFPWTKLMG
jgi:hypothetical protein